MSSSIALDIAAGLLAQPTVPFIENLPALWAMDFSSHHDLDTHRDEAGNVVVTYTGSHVHKSNPPPLVLVAHLDHPGFIVETIKNKVVQLGFRGGLLASHAQPGSALAFFHATSSTPTGSGILIKATSDKAGRLTGGTAEITNGEVLDHGFAMWDFPETLPNGILIDDKRITARACDDLLGVAAILATLATLAIEAPADIAVWGLLTRSEEIGFLGALEAIRLKTVPSDSLVLSLECSQALESAPQGDGVIVRVGDRMSIFDPPLTDALRITADQIASNKTAPNFAYQRKLMDGGACEATAFCAAGFQASGLAVPLGNYHNADDNGPGIAAEHVLISDYLSEVTLLSQLALDPTQLEAARTNLAPAWLAERTAQAREAFNSERSDA